MAKKKPTEQTDILNQLSPVADAAVNAGISQVLSRLHPVAGAAYSAYSGLKKLDKMGVGGSGNPAGPGGDLYTKLGGQPPSGAAPDITRNFSQTKRGEALSDVQNKKMRPKKNRVSAATGGKVSYKSIFDME
jgi:hypothetical protein